MKFGCQREKLGYCSNMVVQHGGLCGRHILYMTLIMNIMFHFPLVLHTGPFLNVVSTSIRSRKIEFLNLPDYTLIKKSSREQASESLNLMYSAMPAPTFFVKFGQFLVALAKKDRLHKSNCPLLHMSAPLTYHIDQPPLPFIHNVPLSVNRLSYPHVINCNQSLDRRIPNAADTKGENLPYRVSFDDCM